MRTISCLLPHTHQHASKYWYSFYDIGKINLWRCYIVRSSQSQIIDEAYMVNLGHTGKRWEGETGREMVDGGWGDVTANNSKRKYSYSCSWQAIFNKLAFLSFHFIPLLIFLSWCRFLKISIAFPEPLPHFCMCLCAVLVFFMHLIIYCSVAYVIRKLLVSGLIYIYFLCSWRDMRYIKTAATPVFYNRTRTTLEPSDSV